MIHDLDEVKKMFVDADNLIKKRPELLSMHIDEIFEELDGTPEMRHIRWGGYDTC
jgi:shikimate kinase